MIRSSSVVFPVPAPPISLAIFAILSPQLIIRILFCRKSEPRGTFCAAKSFSRGVFPAGKPLKNKSETLLPGKPGTKKHVQGVHEKSPI
jgi:hypothetical protein